MLPESQEGLDCCWLVVVGPLTVGELITVDGADDDDVDVTMDDDDDVDDINVDDGFGDVEGVKVIDVDDITKFKSEAIVPLTRGGWYCASESIVAESDVEWLDGIAIEWNCKFCVEDDKLFPLNEPADGIVADNWLCCKLFILLLWLILELDLIKLLGWWCWFVIVVSLLLFVLLLLLLLLLENFKNNFVNGFAVLLFLSFFVIPVVVADVFVDVAPAVYVDNDDNSLLSNLFGLFVNNDDDIVAVEQFDKVCVELVNKLLLPPQLLLLMPLILPPADVNRYRCCGTSFTVLFGGAFT